MTKEETPLPAFPWLASQQYSMRFILSNDNEIVLRADHLPYETLKVMAKAATDLHMPQPTPPTPAGAETETDKLLHGQFRNHEGWRDHPFVILARKLEQQRDDARRQAEADRALIEELKEENDEGWRRVVLAEKNTIPALKEQLAIADKDRERLYHALDNLLESLETGDAEMLPHSITAGLAAIAAMQPSPSLDHGATETPKPL